MKLLVFIHVEWGQSTQSRPGTSPSIHIQLCKATNELENNSIMTSAPPVQPRGGGYGLDQELAKAACEKYDPELEKAAQKWIENVLQVLMSVCLLWPYLWLPSYVAFSNILKTTGTFPSWCLIWSCLERWTNPCPLHQCHPWRHR